MRPCPVCGSQKTADAWRVDFLVPNGWTRPSYINWKTCECGMIYGDNPQITQADYDTYYKDRYGYGVSDEQSKQRLLSRAAYIRGKFEHGVKIVDFGGGDGGLAGILWSYGFSDAHNYTIGDTMPLNVDVMVCEHVLEHIYDMDTTMSMIVKALNLGGTLIVDVPDAAMALDPSPKMPILDFSQVHINHFRTVDMLKMMDRYGFELIETSIYHERNTLCRMYIFRHNPDIISEKSMEIVTKAIEDRVKILNSLGDQPVIIWGCGDIALACLAKANVNIQYFVDNDPAFRGATIKGLPVLESPITDDPIIVLAQSQKGLLLQHINKLNLKNQVVVI